MDILHDDFAEADEIGHEFSRATLVKVIQAVDINASGSFTIGVYGEWGTGKTSMLRQIENELANDDSIVTVWFNPWQFTENENMVLAFFRLFSKKLKDHIENNKSLLVKFGDELIKFDSGLSRGWKSFQSGVSVSVGIPGIFQVGYIGKDAISPESGDGSEEKYIDDSSIYFDLVDHIKSAASGLKCKFVVFVDDLDRCSPNQAIELLDGLKVLFDIPNFVFVLGMANEILENAVKEKYRNMLGVSDEANLDLRVSYMDKIIQFPFNLPRPDAIKVKRNLITPRLGDISCSENFASLILDVVGSNPRSLKRFLNFVSFSESLAQIRFKEQEVKKELVIKAALINFVAPALNRQFEKTPSALVKISSLVKNYDNESGKELSDALETGNISIDVLIDRQIAIKLYNILGGAVGSIGFADENEAANYLQLSADTSQIISEKNSPIAPRSSNSPHIGKYGDNFVRISTGTVVLEEKNTELKVKLTKPFASAIHLVTQALYESITNANPSQFKFPNNPVENVSWYSAVKFANLLSEREQLEAVYELMETENKIIVKSNFDANGYRLPTEAEFQLLVGKDYPGALPIDEIAWYMSNSKTQAQEVGIKKPNVFGLYDLLGNLWEWTNDWYEAVDSGEIDDYCGAKEGSYKICKGGSWANFEAQLNPKFRQKYPPGKVDNNIGFRLVKSI